MCICILDIYNMCIDIYYTIYTILYIHLDIYNVYIYLRYIMCIYNIIYGNTKPLLTSRAFVAHSLMQHRAGAPRK